jgi:hypothetical protein
VATKHRARAPPSGHGRKKHEHAGQGGFEGSEAGRSGRWHARTKSNGETDDRRAVQTTAASRIPTPPRETSAARMLRRRSRLLFSRSDAGDIRAAASRARIGTARLQGGEREAWSTEVVAGIGACILGSARSGTYIAEDRSFARRFQYAFSLFSSANGVNARM